MKNFKYFFRYFVLCLVMFFITLLTNVHDVHALDYYLISKFGGHEPGDVFWLNSGERLSGPYYYKRPTNTSVGDYLDISYCSTGNVSTYTLNRPEIQRDPIHLDTGEWCTTGDYSGTIKHDYYLVGTWTYTADSGYAYIEGSGSYFFNSSSYSSHVLFYGIANISELDMSMAILAWIKSNQNNQDYSNVLNNIQNNTSQFNTELGKVQDTIKDTNKSLDDVKNAINSSDTSGASSNANSFFDNFQTDTYGLSDIITMPLTLIKSLTNSTCVSLKLTIPFVNKDLELPCMSSIYSQYFGSFFSLYQTITFGFVAYWVSVRIFNLVKDFKNPDHDEIEVLDL